MRRLPDGEPPIGHRSPSAPACHKKKSGARVRPARLPEIVRGYGFAGAAALAGVAPAFAAEAAGAAGGICAGVTALPFAFISAK